MPLNRRFWRRATGAGVRLGWLCLTLTTLMALTAHAGHPCKPAKPPTAQALGRSMALAQRTAQALEAEHQRYGTQVVLLGRAGQDLTAYGLHYSHLGWAYRTPAGPWRVVHKLNQCGSAVGQLYRQGLGEFFLDDLWRYEAVWAVPTPAVQQQLWPLLQDKRRVTLLQHRPYSLVSYVWGQRYQQSNQWAIETLAAAMVPDGIRNRDQAQAWLQFQGYRPGTLQISAWRRLGARAASAHIAFDDHPQRQRLTGRIETVTADSVLAWLPRAQLASAPVTLSEGDPP